MTLRLIVFGIGVTPPQFLYDLPGIKHPVRIHLLARLVRYRRDTDAFIPCPRTKAVRQLEQVMYLPFTLVSKPSYADSLSTMIRLRL